MPLDEAQLTHLIAGRLRIRIRARRRDAAFFAEMSRRLAQCEGVTEVRANPLTGSVLIRHATTPDAIAAYADRHGLFELPVAQVSSDETARARARMLMPRDAVRIARRKTEPDEERERRRARRLSATLAGLGTLQTVRGQVMAPALTLFWYAYDAWRSRPLARGRASAPVPPQANAEADPDRR